MADRNACWPARGAVLAVDLTGRALATEHPSGLVTGRPAHCARRREARSGGRIVFVDSRTGSTQDVTVPNGTTDGLSWLDARSLVLNYPAQLGAPNQLIRLPYPAGPLSRLTNDPNDYVGISLSGDRRTSGHRAGGTRAWTCGSATAERRPEPTWCSACRSNERRPCRVVRRSTAVRRRRRWKARNPASDARPEHVRRMSSSKPSRLRPRAMAARSCSCRPPTTRLDLWTADANGRRKTRLVPSVTANLVAVTPDDRFVLFTSIAGGTVSIWMVPIEGGTPTKLTDGTSVAVSPDGGSIAFTAQGARGVPSLVVCSLPGCTSPRTIGPARVRHAGRLDPGRSRRRLRERRESLGAAAQRRRAASAHALHRRPPDRILCVVARRQAPGHHAIDRHQRHRALQRLEVADQGA